MEKRKNKIHFFEKILPGLLTLFTGKERERIEDIDWSPNLWVHNIFRVYEMFFWRRAGIRAEVSALTYRDESGKDIVEYQFHTLEAAFAHLEGMIRNAFKVQWIPIRVYRPQLASIGGMQIPGKSPYLFAIAYDNTGFTTYGSQPRTVSITVAGSNRLMVMHTSSISDPGSSMPTYNSVAATEYRRGSFPGVGRTGSVISGLVAPATGSNTASFPSSGTNLLGQATSYTGASQTGQPDSSGTTSGSGTTITATTTVVAANCWLIGVGSDTVGGGYSNGTGTIRQTSGNGAFFFDSNGTVGTGSQSKTMTMSNGSWEALAVSIASSVSPNISSNMFRLSKA